jgi:hypothetical protein
LSKIKRILAGASFVGLVAGAAWITVNRRLFLVNDVTTGESSDYPELRSHVYFADASNVMAAAKKIIDDAFGWRCISVDDAGAQKKIHAEVEGFFGDFISDITMSASPIGEMHTRVMIRSKSRAQCSGGDLGENAKNIRWLQNEMDQLLTGG